MPRRGWPGAHVLPDTGVLLAVGRKPAVLREFAAHYVDRITVLTAIRDEVRRKAKIPPALRRADDVHACDAAGKVMAHGIDPGLLPVVASPPPVTSADVTMATAVLAALQGAGGDPRQHAGEAAVIVECARRNSLGSRQNVMLANDGPASLVAAAHGVLTRHAGDVLAEFACADPTRTAESLLADFTHACNATRPPEDVLPTTREAFRCRRAGGTCGPCGP